MTRPITSLLSALTAVALASGAAAAPTFNLTGADLNGHTATVPRTGQPTLVLFAFRHGDQQTLDAWRQGLRLRDDDPTWFEVAYIGAPKPVRPMVEASLRKSFADPSARAHMVPVFAREPTEVVRAGLPTAHPLVAVFGGAGAPMVVVEGPYDPTKAKQIAAAMTAVTR